MAKHQKGKRLSQRELVMEFFRENPNKDIPHPKAVDWLTEQWLKRSGEVFRDPDRSIRKLAQTGYLIKVGKGIYRYDPDLVKKRDIEDFSKKQKREILARDNDKCVICGSGVKEGIELHIDHIKPKDLDGKATIENGQTLCAKHNFLKKNLQQTETGKKMFIRLYDLAKKEDDKALQDFCIDILEIYEGHGINGHIEWNR